MNKFLLGTMSLVVAASLQAATVYATVNGKEITQKELAPMLQGLPAGVNLDQLPPQTIKDIVDRAIEIELLTDVAKKSGIEKDKAYIDELNSIKDTLAFRTWQLREFEKIKVNDVEIAEFYERNKDKFVEPEKFGAKHILVKDEKEAKNIIAELKKAKAADLAKSFEKIAKEKSIDPSAKQNGGDLGLFVADTMVKEFSDAVAGLKVNELTKDPVKTQFGYHVILKTNYIPKKQITLKDEGVRDYISALLKEDKYRVKLQNMAKDLTSKAKIEYKIDLKKEPTTK
ncbi:peptidylprolyl isomerase [uncultured Campylobacter sp.]|uniref:peptidylprolyl isomerase n=1 Tax=uncultured Campylobacter sp. TaxID=218934 RepID=UPI002618A419|nr:peptidylprolyl isomerase [uncultured Campylobacter sp.]